MGAGFGFDFLAGLSEGSPTIPKLKPISAQGEQEKAIQGNAKVLPQIENLASGINTFNQEQLTKMLEMAIPGYNNLVSGTSNQIQNFLKGVVPKDVEEAIQRSAAGKSLVGGYGDTGMAHNLNARDLGLTSLDLINKGINSAQSWLSTMKSVATAPQFDVTSMFISPALQIDTAFKEREAQFQRQYVSNLNDWQHSIGYLWGQDMRNTGETVKELASSYLGGMAGCWVAREVFGEANPKWVQFRKWLYSKAPAWFRNLYLKHGERFSAWIKNKPRLKSVIRVWMESRITNQPAIGT